MTDPLRTPDRIAFAGDWHMNSDWAYKAIAHAARQAADVVIHLGDFGYTYNAKFMKACDRALSRAGIPLLFVDGNHEDFTALLRYPIRDNGLRQLSDWVWHLPRGFRWAWVGVRFLALGGAHSVDRRWRTPGASWWREETISTMDAHRATTGGQVDVLVCHDCPSGVDLPGLARTAHLFPPEEIRAADQHRDILRSVVDEVRPAHIWHGHYHDNAHRSVVDLGCGPVTVTGLDCDESTLSRNVSVVRLADLACTTGNPRGEIDGLPYTYLPGLIDAECCPTTTDVDGITGTGHPRVGMRVWVWDDAVMLLGEATIVSIDERGVVELSIVPGSIRRVDQYPFPPPSDQAEE